MLGSLFFALAVAGQSAFEPGVTIRLYDIGKPMNAIPKLVPGQTPNLDRILDAVDIPNGGFFGFSDRFYLVLTADFRAETAGRYRFRITSDDGARLWVNKQVVTEADGIHPEVVAEGGVDLKAGWVPLELQYFEETGGERLKVEWAKEGGPWQVLDRRVTRVPAGLTRVVSPGPKRITGSGTGVRPGNGAPLAGLHPGWDLYTARPLDWNPQVGGLAFRADGALFVSTFKPNQSGSFDPNLKDGEIWLLKGVTGNDRTKITRRLVAKDLSEPLGLLVRGKDLFVSTRNEVLRMRDTNGDDVLDERTVVASGWATDNYHHFTFGLAEGGDGRLYAALSTAIEFRAPGINGPNPRHRGSMFAFDPDRYDPGQPLANIEFLSSGHRTPNGVSTGPNGLVLVGENQGSWQPSNKINILQPGGFFGHFNNTDFRNERYPNGGQPGLFDHQPYTPPAIDLPQGEIANSPGQMVAIPSGLFKDHLLITDVKYGGLRRGWLDEVEGTYNGGAVQFSQGLEVGMIRAIWGPDGGLYLGGLGATESWAWTDPVTGKWTQAGLQRLKPNGKSAFEVVDVRANSIGFRVRFTEPIAPSIVRSLGQISVQQWRYNPTIDYGGPKVDREFLPVSGAVLSKDGKQLDLVVPGVKEDRTVYFNFRLKSAKGRELWASEVWYRLNRMPRPWIRQEAALAVPKPRVMVFSKTTGFRHDSIPEGIAMIQSLGKARGWTVTATEDSAKFTPANLSQFDVVVFLNTTGDVLDAPGKQAFERFIRNGGGFVGIHSATDTEYNWPFYTQLVGAQFASHPPTQSADLSVTDGAHPSTTFLPRPWARVDEWYDFKNGPGPGVRVLMTLDERTTQGNKMGSNHPVVWCQEVAGGRSWYTELGHTKSTYSEALFQQHVAEGIVWAAQAKVPSDAIRMDVTKWQAEGWTSVGGVLSNGTGNQNLVSKAEFQDVQLHAEFRVPKGGNSGIYLMGRYEIQILDSHGVPVKDLKSSMCGSVYERWRDEKGYEGHPPLRNAARPAGEWQTMDIVFQAPRFKNGKKVQDAAFVEVRLNGVLVQSRVRLSGPTRGAVSETEVAMGPILLQGDHGPIEYRNLWVRGLSSSGQWAAKASAKPLSDR